MRHNQYCLLELITLGVKSPISETDLAEASDEEIDAALANIYQQRISTDEFHPEILELLSSIKYLEANEDVKIFLREWLGILRDGFINGKAKNEGSSKLQSLIQHAPGATLEINLYQLAVKQQLENDIFQEKELRRVKGAIKELTTPDWYTDLPNIVAQLNRQKGVSRSAWIGIDLALCIEYLRTLNLIPIFDHSVRYMVHSVYPCTNPELLSSINQVVFTNMETLASIAEEDQRIVWISSCTSLGSPIRYDNGKLIGQALSDGRIYGILSGSCFNGGYAGLRLLEFNSMEWSYGEIKREHITFMKGGVSSALHSGPPTSSSLTLGLDQ